ncbi:alpha/beta fold hydrolase [Nonomuraea purpurea]|uniref:Alpha/beta fold hydrolase n=1 Tax=Nonomuraea purpurea TaxID=1849276 RepID=A0ABV8GV87_9ACTN
MLLPAVPAAASQPAVPSHECAAATERCDGTLSVPLDWSDPSSERVTVAFAWLPATKRPGRATGTILANPGGPMAALPDLPRIQQVLGPVLEDQNLLVVEPRGLGTSSPLLCPGLNLTAPETIAPCAERLGPRVQFFTADQAVHDMDAVRQALGVPKITFYGNSYGTLFAQAYAAAHPSSLAAAFLDSTVITSADGYALWPNRSRLDQLDLVCGQSRACRALPGRASGTWTDLVTRLRAHPDPKVPISALTMVNNVYDPVFGREANAAATAYLRGDPAPLRRLTQVVPGLPQQPAEGPEWAGFLAYRCGDGSFPFDRDASPAERQAQLQRHFLQERPLAPYTPADLGRDITKDLDFCVQWPTPRHSPPLPPRAKLPSVPIMVVGGDFDTQSPAEVARALRAFPKATFVRVPFAGHSLAPASGEMGDCVRTAMRSFLTNHQIPDVRCTAENYRAIGSFPRTISDIPPIAATGLSPEQRRLLAVTFATSADAVARRNPYSTPTHSRLDTQPGLRGGQVRFGDATITLEQVSLVRGLKVSGQIAIPSTRQAAATLQVSTGDGQPHRIKLEWQPFTPHERPALSGVVDDTPFIYPAT